MLIFIKTSIKTTAIILLFTFTRSYLFAHNQGSEYLAVNGVYEWSNRISGDTVTTNNTVGNKESQQNTKFIIPDNLINEPIDFQVNSAISYLRFSHFIKEESRKTFYQAWLKKKEANKLNIQADSLRKAYILSSNEKKDEISALILKTEEQMLSLNQEIPELYEKARNEESLYWQSATTDELIKFQEKLKAYKDSVEQKNQEINQKNDSNSPEIPDTIVLYTNQPKTQEIKAATTTGIVYKIQIGAYKGKTPELAAKLIKKLSMIRKVENYKDEKGVNVYTTGNLKVYQEAVILQNQVKQEGVKNATIAAYQNGKRITVEEARKINNEL